MTEAQQTAAKSPKDSQKYYKWSGRIVYLSNIPFKVKAQDIMLICKQFGRCYRVDLAKNGIGQSRGYAFIEFETREAAQICVEQLDTAQLRENHLRCEISDFPPNELVDVYRKTARERKELDNGNALGMNGSIDNDDSRAKSRQLHYSDYSDVDNSDKYDRKRDYSDYSSYYSDYSSYYSDYSYSYSDYSDYSDYSSYNYFDTSDFEHPKKSGSKKPN